MKRFLCVCAILAFCVCAFAAEIESGHYRIQGEVAGETLYTLASALNGFWGEFNELFRFNPEGPGFLSSVTVFPSKTEYDAYIQKKIDQRRKDYTVFLKYSNPEKSELVLYDNGDMFTPALTRQAFFQYLYSYIQNPPLWISEGFAIYFESLYYDADSGKTGFRDAELWLDTVKRMRADSSQRIDVAALMRALPGVYTARQFNPQAWAFVVFLLNTDDKNASRLLWDGFYQISMNDSLTENTDSVLLSFSEWKNLDVLNTEFDAWLSGQKTFNDYINDGVDFYNANNFDKAEEAFIAASALNGTDPFPPYYRGLIAYSDKRYEDAEAFYLAAMRNGADKATVNWALGLNAYADKRYSEARDYLLDAKNADSERYGARVDEIMQDISNLSNANAR